jgi:predicted nucleic acid-binding protein
MLNSQQQTSFMIDSNIFDQLEREPDDFIRQLRHAVEKGLVNLYITYIQLAELQAIPRAERRERLQGILHAVSPQPMPATAVYDLAKYDDPLSVYADAEQVAAHDDWAKANHAAHGNDAVIARAAQEGGFVLVTENTKDMGKKARRTGIEVWGYARFRAHVASLA